MGKIVERLRSALHEIHCTLGDVARHGDVIGHLRALVVTFLGEAAPDMCCGLPADWDVS